MTNASRDGNHVPTLLAVQNTDGETIVPVKVDPTTHGLKINDGTSGTDYGPDNSLRDENFTTTLIAVSSADGVTPVVVYADSDGNILVDNT